MKSLPNNPFSTRTCWICGKTVRLEECRVDEYGLPVHEECQALKLSLRNTAPGRISKAQAERASDTTRRFGRLQIA